jgi:hypothetical protein
MIGWLLRPSRRAANKQGKALANAAKAPSDKQNGKGKLIDYFDLFRCLLVEYTIYN